MFIQDHKHAQLFCMFIVSLKYYAIIKNLQYVQVQAH